MTSGKLLKLRCHTLCAEVISCWRFWVGRGHLLIRVSDCTPTNFEFASLYCCIIYCTFPTVTSQCIQHTKGIQQVVPCNISQSCVRIIACFPPPHDFMAIWLTQISRRKLRSLLTGERPAICNSTQKIWSLLLAFVLAHAK